MFIDQRPNQILILSTKFDFESNNNNNNKTQRIKKLPLDQKRIYVAWVTEDCVLLKVRKKENKK